MTGVATVERLWPGVDVTFAPTEEIIPESIDATTIDVKFAVAAEETTALTFSQNARHLKKNESY